MRKMLTAQFFNRPTLVVARELIGCFLCRRVGKRVVRLAITETEAYDGPQDRASHASRGKTPRNSPMFGPSGHFYVYFTYGMHWMLNVVTGPKGYPAAILIRGTQNISGPARLTKFLKIDKRLNGKPATKKSGLWFERGEEIPDKNIRRTPRIGVAYAGTWAKKKYRYVVEKREKSK